MAYYTGRNDVYIGVVNDENIISFSLQCRVMLPDGKQCPNRGCCIVTCDEDDSEQWICQEHFDGAEKVAD